MHLPNPNPAHSLSDPSPELPETAAPAREPGMDTARR
uniref:Uncharacterized protein n=1 Tax=Arundo donax TaxID=35708 RepID=A0A0A9G3N2_ARUDO